MDLVTIVQGEKLQRLQINDIGYLNDSPLISIRVSLDGSITAFYKNGLDRKIGRIALALFQNQRRLERSGSHCLLPTEGSGDPYLDYVHVDGRGSLYGSSLEEVDEHIYSLALDDAH